MFLLKNKKNKIKVENKDKKFDLKTLVWIGFNYTCGMAFPLAFSSVIYSSIDSPGTGIGLWIYLVLFLGSILAGIMGYAFSKMAKVYVKSNGATYTYVRASFGRFAGWAIGIIQYVVVPLGAVSLILSMIDLNFAPYVDWGVYSNLYLNLIGILIYVTFASVIFFGLKYFKMFINISGFLKWFSTIFIVVCSLALAGLDKFGGFNEAKTATQNIDHEHFFSNFNSAFVTMFYFYAGFETYTTIVKNVKNPSKTMPRAILWITILALLFYVTITIFFMGILTPDNVNGGAWFSDNPPLSIATEVAGSLGAALVIVAMVTLKVNAAMQNSLYASGMLEPLAVEHYISPKFGRLSKEKVSNLSSLLNIILTVILTLLLICLPILIINLLDPEVGNNVDYSAIVGFVTVAILLQYLCVLLSIFKLYFTKQMLLKKWEIFIFTISLLFIIFEIIMFFYSDIVSIIQNLNQVSGVFSLISLALFLILIISIILIYYFYYNPIYKRRIKDQPELQEKLNNEFKISGYAKLEIDLFNNKTNKLKTIKQEFLSNSKLISKQQNKEEKNEFKKQKKDYMSDYKIEIITLKKEYKNKLKEIKNHQDSYQVINDLHFKKVENLHNLKLNKTKTLFDLKLNIIKKYSLRYNYKTSKQEIIEDMSSKLEYFILNVSDTE